MTLYVEQLGRVEKEQQWPEYRALWYTPQQNDQQRQTPGVRHMHAENVQPAENLSRQTDDPRKSRIDKSRLEFR